MTRLTRHLVVALFLLVAPALFAAAPINGICTTRPSEQLHYVWKLRGALSWVAGLRFPTSGIGELKTSSPGSGVVDTELKITPQNGKGGFYVYQSQLDRNGAKTLTTYHGYAWGENERHERTRFDYAKRLVRIQKESRDDGIENKVKPLPDQALRDVLTGIYFLRQNADTIHAPLQSSIFSDGKLYPVVYTPGATKVLTWKGKNVTARSFTITAVPNARKRWPGGVTVWLSEDEQHIPFRIEIEQSAFASLQLDLSFIEPCA